MEKECEKGSYLVRREDVHEGGVYELSIWNKIQRIDRRAKNDICKVVMPFNTGPNPWLKRNQEASKSYIQSNILNDQELKNTISDNEKDEIKTSYQK